MLCKKIITASKQIATRRRFFKNFQLDIKIKSIVLGVTKLFLFFFLLLLFACLLHVNVLEYTGLLERCFLAAFCLFILLFFA